MFEHTPATHAAQKLAIADFNNNRIKRHANEFATNAEFIAYDNMYNQAHAAWCVVHNVHSSQRRYY